MFCFFIVAVQECILEIFHILLLNFLNFIVFQWQQLHFFLLPFATVSERERESTINILVFNNHSGNHWLGYQPDPGEVGKEKGRV